MLELERYLNQDIFNPKYLFHGTAYKVEKLECSKSVDGDKDSINNAVFLSSSFYTSAAYAFSRALKMVNKEYSFKMNNNGELPAMTFEVDEIPEDLCGFVYCFEKDDDMIKDNHEYTTQYRCYHDLIPQKVIKVYYRDFEQYFKRENYP